MMEAMMPQMMMEMMPQCLRMMLLNMPKEKRIDFVLKMVTTLVEQGCVGMSEEEKKDFKERYRHLHILINNAGIYFTKRRVTVDGIEATFAVNYLARFLLTNLLLATLKNSSPARIINVAGAYHSKGTIDFDDLQKEKDYDGARANNQSKLADVLFTYELARRLKETGVTVNCLHPGAIASTLFIFQIS